MLNIATLAEKWQCFCLHILLALQNIKMDIKTAPLPAPANPEQKEDQISLALRCLHIIYAKTLKISSEGIQDVGKIGLLLFLVIAGIYILSVIEYLSPQGHKVHREHNIPDIYAKYYEVPSIESKLLWIKSHPKHFASIWKNAREKYPKEAPEFTDNILVNLESKGRKMVPGAREKLQNDLKNLNAGFVSRTREDEKFKQLLEEILGRFYEQKDRISFINQIDNNVTYWATEQQEFPNLVNKSNAQTSIERTFFVLPDKTEDEINDYKSWFAKALVHLQAALKAGKSSVIAGVPLVKVFAVIAVAWRILRTPTGKRTNLQLGMLLVALSKFLQIVIWGLVELKILPYKSKKGIYNLHASQYGLGTLLAIIVMIKVV